MWAASHPSAGLLQSDAVFYSFISTPAHAPRDAVAVLPVVLRAIHEASGRQTLRAAAAAVAAISLRLQRAHVRPPAPTATC